MVLRSGWSRVPVLALLVLTCEVGLQPDTTGVSAAQQKPLTIADIYSYEGWSRFNGSPEATMSWALAVEPWLSDTHFLWPGPEAREPWLRVEATSGRSQPLFTTGQVEAALVKTGVSVNGARDATRQRPAIFNSRRDAFVMVIDADLYLYDITTAAATRLTSSPGAKSEVTFSPDGRAVAFIKNNNLYVTTYVGRVLPFKTRRIRNAR